MVLTFCFVHVACAHAPTQVNEVDMNVMWCQLLRYRWIDAVHYCIAFGIHVSERAAEKNLDVLASGSCSHNLKFCYLWVDCLLNVICLLLKVRPLNLRFFNRDLLKTLCLVNFMSFKTLCLLSFKKLYVFKKAAYISYPCKVKHFIYDDQQFPNNKFSFHRLLAVD